MSKGEGEERGSVRVPSDLPSSVSPFPPTPGVYWAAPLPGLPLGVGTIRVNPR